MAVVAVAVLVVIAAAVAVPALLSSTPTSTVVHLYNVTFTAGSDSGPSKSGTVPYFETATETFESTTRNLVGIWIDASYQDQSTSPLTDPQVGFVFSGPEDMDAGPWVILVPPSGWTGVLLVDNAVPDNSTVNATSPEEAITLVTEGMINETLGVGEWSVVVDVGAAAGGRVRPGSISYSLDIRFDFVTVEATALP